MFHRCYTSNLQVPIVEKCGAYSCSRAVSTSHILQPDASDSSTLFILVHIEQDDTLSGTRPKDVRRQVTSLNSWVIYHKYKYRSYEARNLFNTSTSSSSMQPRLQVLTTIISAASHPQSPEEWISGRTRSLPGQTLPAVRTSTSNLSNVHNFPVELQPSLMELCPGRPLYSTHSPRNKVRSLNGLPGMYTWPSSLDSANKFSAGA